MAKRDRRDRPAGRGKRDRAFTTDVDVSVPERDEDESGDREARSRVRASAGRLVSVRVLALALVASAGAVVIVGGLVPLPVVSEPLSIALAAFLVGLVSEGRHYLETGLAGAVVGGGAALVDAFVLTLLGVGVPVVVVGVVGGLLAGLAGHYFGRDLRHGLTRDL